MKILDLKNVTFQKSESSKYLDVAPKIEVPQYLYKFYALNKFSVTNIEANNIFFSSANQLNDVLEGNFELLWDFENFKKNKNVYPDFQEKIIRGSDGFKKDFLRWRGIFSVSEVLNNELLWIHYTNEAGFCLEIDTLKINDVFQTNSGLNHSYFYPISYHDPVTKIDFNDYAEFTEVNNKQHINALLAIMYCLSVKEIHWAYEKEWRLSINNEKFNYQSDLNDIISDEKKEFEGNKAKSNNLEIDPNIFNKVILGTRFFNNNRFNKVEKFQDNIELYGFKNNEEGKFAQRLLKSLSKNFKDSVYQINKVAANNIISREINLRIEIIDIQDEYVKIKKHNLK